MILEVVFALTTMWLCDDLGVCRHYAVTELEPTTSTTETSTTTTSTTEIPTTTTSLRTVYGMGYLGAYDQNGDTVQAWPANPGMHTILGGVDGQGGLIVGAKARAAIAGHLDATFLFYLGFGQMDSGCNCFESRVYATMPEACTLHDASGARVSTNNGRNRVFAFDVGNPDCVARWKAAVVAEVEKHQWDGVWADYVNRGCVDDTNGFWGWSGWPVNPRTGKRYQCAAFRADTLAGLRGLKPLVVVINHGGAWNHPTDPTLQAQVAASAGVHLEDCVFQMGTGNPPYAEPDWLKQLVYLDYANRHSGGAVTCQGYGGALNDAGKRRYLETTLLLVKRGYSGLGQLNTAARWLAEYDEQLGPPLGEYQCYDHVSPCPHAGTTFFRNYLLGTVAVNPGSVARAGPCGVLAAYSGTICHASVLSRAGAP